MPCDHDWECVVDPSPTEVCAKCGIAKFEEAKVYLEVALGVLKIGREYRAKHQPSSMIRYIKVAGLDVLFLQNYIDDHEMADECIAAVFSLIHQIGAMLADAEAAGHIDVHQLETRLKEFTKRE